MEFKAGDRLRCNITDNQTAKFGQTYTIFLSSYYDYMLKCEKIGRDCGIRSESYLLENFVLLPKQKFYLDI